MLNTFQKFKNIKFHISRGKNKRVRSFNSFNFCNFCNFCNFRIVTIATILTILTFATSIVFAGITGIRNTKHDLSTGGSGPIQATGASGVTQKCVFCHTPHSSTKEGPLWNHSLSSATYSVRDQAWTDLNPQAWRVTIAGQPDGSSRLCLGCHDGTVALGLLVNVPGSGMGGTVDMTQTYMPCGPTDYTCLGTNFVSSGKHLDGFGTGDHLISMQYNSALYTDVLAKCYPPESSVTYPIKDPSTISSTDPVKLYDTKHKYPGPDDGGVYKGVQCRSCHDPHDNTNEKFLVKGSPTDWDPLCNTCHMLCP